MPSPKGEGRPAQIGGGEGREREDSRRCEEEGLFLKIQNFAFKGDVGDGNIGGQTSTSTRGSRAGGRSGGLNAKGEEEEAGERKYEGRRKKTS